MKISSEFSKHALEYDSYSVIQNRVIDKLLSDLNYQPSKILDLGCGNGALCKKIEWRYKHFTGVDFAPQMLEMHPKSKKIEAIYGDFNDKRLFENLAVYNYDYLFSASALQWADDLEQTFANIAALEIPISLAIFTSGTFLTLNTTASLKPLLKDKENLALLARKYFDGNIEVGEYKLAFESDREMFHYIKRSGVSGSRNILGYKETKNLMREYPLDYLEFGVAFIRT